MFRVDLPRVMPIERACFLNPWTEGQFRELLAEADDPATGTYCVVSRRAGNWEAVVGYIIFQVHLREDYIDLMSVAVSPPYQKRGIGSELVRFVKEVLGRDVSCCIARLPETHSLPQYFFALNGFDPVAVEIDHDGRRFIVVSYDLRPSEHGAPEDDGASVIARLLDGDAKVR